MLLNTRYIRVFRGRGNPIHRWIPSVIRSHYAKHWGLYGFHVFWLGIELGFSFGHDRNGLYDK